MSALTHLQEAYADPSSDRIRIIHEMEFIENDEKWDFLIGILSNNANDYPEKIQTLRIAEVNSVPEKYFDSLAKIILHITKTEEDEEVRNYAVIAMKNFTANKGIVAQAKEILLDGNEDIDVRWNAFDIFKTKKSGPEFEEVVKALSGTKEFGQAVQRLASGTQPSGWPPL